MTIEIQYRERFPVTSETYWRELCLNLEYVERMYREAVSCISMQVLEHEGSYETGVKRRLRFQKPLDAPAAIRKVFGDTVSLDEVSEWNARDKAWSYRMIPAVMGDRMEIRGVVRLDEDARGVEQISVNTASCHIFGLGSIIEHFVAKSTKDGNQDRSAFTHRYIAEKSLR